MTFFSFPACGQSRLHHVTLTRRQTDMKRSVQGCFLLFSLISSVILSFSTFQVSTSSATAVASSVAGTACEIDFPLSFTFSSCGLRRLRRLKGSFINFKSSRLKAHMSFLFLFLVRHSYSAVCEARKRKSSNRRRIRTIRPPRSPGLFLQLVIPPRRDLSLGLEKRRASFLPSFRSRIFQVDQNKTDFHKLFFELILK